MTNEEVIYTLTFMFNNISLARKNGKARMLTSYIEAVTKAIEALEKQNSKVPEKTSVKTWWGIPYKAWCCPSCGTPVKNMNEHFCEKCGQKLKGIN